MYCNFSKSIIWNLPGTTPKRGTKSAGVPTTIFSTGTVTEAAGISAPSAAGSTAVPSAAAAVSAGAAGSVTAGSAAALSTGGSTGAAGSVSALGSSSFGA